MKQGDTYSHHHPQTTCFPDCQAALMQHVKRATFQGAFVWGQSLVPNQSLPDVRSWGWIESPSHEIVPY